MKSLTTADILAGAAYAVAHPEQYDQRKWCGTAQCVLGHARTQAGSDQPGEGLREDEYTDGSPRGLALRSMLVWAHEDTAALMRFVGKDGILRVPAGGVGKFGDSVRVGVGCWIGAGSTIGADSIISIRSVICERCEIGEGCVIGAVCWIGAGSTIGADSVIGSDSMIGAGVRVGPRSGIGAGCEIAEGCEIGPRSVICAGARVAPKSVIPYGAVID